MFSQTNVCFGSNRFILAIGRRLPLFRRARLRDPDSAQFQDAFIIGTSKNRTVCGIVNAKNGFGGYSGYAPFVYRELSESVEFGSDDNSGSKIKESCTNEKFAEVDEKFARLKATLAAKGISPDQKVPPELQKEYDEVETGFARLKASGNR